MDILEIQNYSLSFKLQDGIFNVLDDISLEIPKKSMVALVGESGCGKSMTAMSILRLLPKNAVINSGKIIFNNKNILELSEKEMRNIRGTNIALIPQDPMTSLNPLYTVGNQLFEIIKKNNQISEHETKKQALEVFDIVKIPDAKNKLNMYPHEFSGGMKQRAIIAMALASNAELILADEPTTALDVTIQAQIMNILNDIKQNRGISILFISHDLNLVGQYADNINVMYSGRIVENADVEDFFKRTLHPYSKALLEALPAGKDVHEKLQTIDGQPPNITERINGCKFNPRCDSIIGNICCIEKPNNKEYSPNHFVKCHKYN